jgi:hypothetical protein
MRQFVAPVLGHIRHAWLAEQIGVFGWGCLYDLGDKPLCDLALPKLVYSAWKGLLLVLGTVAFVLGSWRQRLAPVVLIFTYVTGAVALVTLGSSQTGGFVVSPRYLQPAFLAFPLVWGEMILLNRDRLAPWLRRALIVASATVVAVTNGFALLAKSRRYSVGTDGPWSYLIDGGQWAPPGGWLPWTALTVAGAAVLVVGFARVLPREDRVGTRRVKPPSTAPA